MTRPGCPLRCRVKGALARPSALGVLWLAGALLAASAPAYADVWRGVDASDAIAASVHDASSAVAAIPAVPGSVADFSAEAVPETAQGPSASEAPPWVPGALPADSLAMPPLHLVPPDQTTLIYSSSSIAPPPPWHSMLVAAANESGVDAALLEALVAVESNFNPWAVSRSGAVGLMQVRPNTATSVTGVRGSRRTMVVMLFDPATNLRVGAHYVRQLMTRFSNQLDLVLAAYNAGVGNVLKAGGRVPPNRETPAFVKKVLERYASIRLAARPPILSLPMAVVQSSPIARAPLIAAVPADSQDATTNAFSPDGDLVHGVHRVAP